MNDDALIGFGISDGDDAPSAGPPLERSNGHALARIAFTLEWQCENARHRDTLVMPRFNFWRDILPPELEAGLLDQPRGHRARHRFAPGELIENPAPDARRRLPARAFNRRYRKGSFVEPRAGRFYPRGFIAGTAGIYPGDVRPFRVTGVGEDALEIDLSHPLAGRALSLEARLEAIWAAGEEHGGRCEDVVERVCGNGPGMQARWRNQPTDFFSDLPFTRLAPEPDAAFYALPRHTDLIDAQASAQIADLHRRLLPAQGHILDLGAGAHSRLPSDTRLRVSGLGMNAAEMAANPALDGHQVQDLNLDPHLPWDDAHFDGAICCLSVEYLTRPFEVFAELARVLRPGSPLVISFSEHWHAPKVVRVWEGAHPFERPGIVLEYLLREGLFRDLETCSLRGLPRAPDDPGHALCATADPVYAVWGHRR